MLFYKQARSLPKRFRLVLASFLQRPGLIFADALTEGAIHKAFEDGGAGFLPTTKRLCTHRPSSDHIAIGAERRRLAAGAEFHRRHAIHRRELAGHRLE